MRAFAAVAASLILVTASANNPLAGRPSPYDPALDSITSGDLRGADQALQRLIDDWEIGPGVSLTYCRQLQTLLYYADAYGAAKVLTLEPAGQLPPDLAGAARRQLAEAHLAFELAAAQSVNPHAGSGGLPWGLPPLAAEEAERIAVLPAGLEGAADVGLLELASRAGLYRAVEAAAYGELLRSPAELNAELVQGRWLHQEAFNDWIVQSSRELAGFAGSEILPELQAAIHSLHEPPDHAAAEAEARANPSALLAATRDRLVLGDRAATAELWRIAQGDEGQRNAEEALYLLTLAAVADMEAIKSVLPEVNPEQVQMLAELELQMLAARQAFARAALDYADLAITGPAMHTLRISLDPSRAVVPPQLRPRPRPDEKPPPPPPPPHGAPPPPPRPPGYHAYSGMADGSPELAAAVQTALESAWKSRFRHSLLFRWPGASQGRYDLINTGVHFDHPAYARWLMVHCRGLARTVPHKADAEVFHLTLDPAGKELWPPAAPAGSDTELLERAASRAAELLLALAAEAEVPPEWIREARHLLSGLAEAQELLSVHDRRCLDLLERIAAAPTSAPADAQEALYLLVLIHAAAVRSAEEYIQKARFEERFRPYQADLEAQRLASAQQFSRTLNRWLDRTTMGIQMDLVQLSAPGFAGESRDLFPDLTSGDARDRLLQSFSLTVVQPFDMGSSQTRLGTLARLDALQFLEWAAGRARSLAEATDVATAETLNAVAFRAIERRQELAAEALAPAEGRLARPGPAPLPRYGALVDYPPSPTLAEALEFLATGRDSRRHLEDAALVPGVAQRHAELALLLLALLHYAEWDTCRWLGPALADANADVASEYADREQTARSSYARSARHYLDVTSNGTSLRTLRLSVPKLPLGRLQNDRTPEGIVGSRAFARDSASLRSNIALLSHRNFLQALQAGAVSRRKVEEKHYSAIPDMLKDGVEIDMARLYSWIASSAVEMAGRPIRTSASSCWKSQQRRTRGCWRCLRSSRRIPPRPECFAPVVRDTLPG